MRLEDALEQLSTIHEQVLRSETFRGYRAVTVGATAGLALAAAIVQEFFLQPADATSFALYWITIASIAAVGIAADLTWQARAGQAERRRTWLALRQLLPAIAVGAVLTMTLLETEVADRLPAIWALIFGLGIVASRPFLPTGLGYVALFFLAAGALLLLPAFRSPLPSPLAMGLIFACGQGSAAIMLYRAELVRDLPTEGSRS